MMRPPLRKCAVCGEIYEGMSRFCSQYCHDRYMNEMARREVIRRQKEQYKNEMIRKLAEDSVRSTSSFGKKFKFPKAREIGV